MHEGRLDEARVAASRAAENLETCGSAHGLLAMVLFKLGERRAAESLIEQAIALPGGDADSYDALAFVSLQLGLHERSNALYRRATEAAPREARFWYNLATSERSFGRLSAAEDACQRAIDVNAGSYQSYLLRSELCIQSAASNHVDELLGLATRPGLDDRGRMFLAYAVAKELDDLGRYDEAFRWFHIGASTRRRHLAYDVATDEDKLKRIAAAFSLEIVRSTAANPEASAAYVFVMGLPRSGTTLVERILTGLAGVRSNGETDHFATALLGSLGDWCVGVSWRRLPAGRRRRPQRSWRTIRHTGRPCDIWPESSGKATDELPVLGRDPARASGCAACPTAARSARQLLCYVPDAVCLGVPV